MYPLKYTEGHFTKTENKTVQTQLKIKQLSNARAQEAKASSVRPMTENVRPPQQVASNGRSSDGVYSRTSSSSFLEASIVRSQHKGGNYYNPLEASSVRPKSEDIDIVRSADGEKIIRPQQADSNIRPTGDYIATTHGNFKPQEASSVRSKSSENIRPQDTSCSVRPKYSDSSVRSHNRGNHQKQSDSDREFTSSKNFTKIADQKLKFQDSSKPDFYPRPIIRKGLNEAVNISPVNANFVNNGSPNNVFLDSDSTDTKFVNSELLNPKSVNNGVLLDTRSVNNELLSTKSVNNELLNPKSANNGVLNPKSVNNGVLLNPKSVNNGLLNTRSVNNKLENVINTIEAIQMECESESEFDLYRKTSKKDISVDSEYPEGPDGPDKPEGPEANENEDFTVHFVHYGRKDNKMEEQTELLFQINELQEAVIAMKSSLKDAMMNLSASSDRPQTPLEFDTLKKKCEGNASEILKMVLSLKTDFSSLKDDVVSISKRQEILQSSLRLLLGDRQLLNGGDVTPSSIASKDTRSRLDSSNSFIGTAETGGGGQSESGSHSNDSGVALQVDKKSTSSPTDGSSNNRFPGQATSDQDSLPDQSCLLVPSSVYDYVAGLGDTNATYSATGYSAGSAYFEPEAHLFNNVDNCRQIFNAEKENKTLYSQVGGQNNIGITYDSDTSILMSNINTIYDCEKSISATMSPSKSYSDLLDEDHGKDLLRSRSREARGRSMSRDRLSSSQSRKKRPLLGVSSAKLYQSTNHSHPHSGDRESRMGHKYASKSDSKEGQRYKIARELLETEKQYCRTLWTIQDTFAEPLKKEGILSNKDISKLFPDEVYQLYEKHCLLQHQLRERLASWKWQPLIGDILNRFIDPHHCEILRLYTTYVNEFPEILKTFHSLCHSSQPFNDFINKCLEQPNCRGMDLGNYLLSPVQRIPKYILILKYLLKYTEVSHPDYRSIYTVLERLRDFLEKLNCAIEHSFRLVNNPVHSPFSRSQHSRAQNSNTDHSIIPHSSSQHSNIPYSSSLHSNIPYSSTDHSSSQYSSTQHSRAQHSSIQHSRAQHSNVEHSTGLTVLPANETYKSIIYDSCKSNESTYGSNTEDVYRRTKRSPSSASGALNSSGKSLSVAPSRSASLPRGFMSIPSPELRDDILEAHLEIPPEELRSPTRCGFSKKSPRDTSIYCMKSRSKYATLSPAKSATNVNIPASTCEGEFSLKHWDTQLTSSVPSLLDSPGKQLNPSPINTGTAGHSQHSPVSGQTRDLANLDPVQNPTTSQAVQCPINSQAVQCPTNSQPVRSSTNSQSAQCPTSLQSALSPDNQPTLLDSNANCGAQKKQNSGKSSISTASTQKLVTWTDAVEVSEEAKVKRKGTIKSSIKNMFSFKKRPEEEHRSEQEQMYWSTKNKTSHSHLHSTATSNKSPIYETKSVCSADFASPIVGDFLDEDGNPCSNV